MKYNKLEYGLLNPVSSGNGTTKFLRLCLDPCTQIQRLLPTAYPGLIQLILSDSRFVSVRT